jgi:hypothetical protein
MYMYIVYIHIYIVCIYYMYCIYVGHTEAAPNLERCFIFLCEHTGGTEIAVLDIVKRTKVSVALRSPRTTTGRLLCCEERKLLQARPRIRTHRPRLRTQRPPQHPPPQQVLRQLSQQQDHSSRGLCSSACYMLCPQQARLRQRWG